MRIEMRGVEKNFDGVPVLKGIDFSGDVTTLAVIGPSGGASRRSCAFWEGSFSRRRGRSSWTARRCPMTSRASCATVRALGSSFRTGASSTI